MEHGTKRVLYSILLLIGSMILLFFAFYLLFAITDTTLEDEGLCFTIPNEPRQCISRVIPSV